MLVCDMFKAHLVDSVNKQPLGVYLNKPFKGEMPKLWNNLLT